jgi:RNA polymerase sigma-70 factor (family 1)
VDANVLPDQDTLISRIEEGDEIAFTKLFDFYRPKIYSVALTITKSATIAEDLVQDVFMTCWIKRRDLNAIKNFNSYLFTMVRNASFTALRKLASERNKLEQHAGSDIFIYTTPDKKTESIDYEELLRQALAKLPEQQRRVFVMIKQKGMDREAVATELGISPNTVKTHLGRAMKFIRAWFHANTLIFLFFFLFFA